MSVMTHFHDWFRPGPQLTHDHLSMHAKNL